MAAPQMSCWRPGIATTVAPMWGSVPVVSSLVLPGAGQALRGRWLDGLLFAWAALWLRLTLAGVAWALDRASEALPAALWGAWAMPGQGALPQALAFTVALAGLHAWAAVDAARVSPRP